MPVSNEEHATALRGLIEWCPMVTDPRDIQACVAGAEALEQRDELLEALKGMVWFFAPKQGQGVCIDAVMQAEAAIAKAEGRL